MCRDDSVFMYINPYESGHKHKERRRTYNEKLTGSYISIQSSMRVRIQLTNSFLGRCLGHFVLIIILRRIECYSNVRVNVWRGKHHRLTIRACARDYNFNESE